MVWTLSGGTTTTNQVPLTKPPSPAAATISKSNKNIMPESQQTSDPTAFRPVGQQEELEALRQRGLAKLLNRHFTAATQKIAQEKAAAEAALRDLEDRKAQQQASATTPPVSPSRGSGVSQWEELYSKVNKWRNECRQKERETLLLYQRYVDKFGGTGHVQVPSVSETVGVTTPARSATTESEGPSPTMASPSSALPSSQNVVAASVQHLEDNLNRRRQDSSNIVIPSLDLLGAYESFATLNAKDEAEFRNFYRHQMEKLEEKNDTKQPSESEPNGTSTSVDPQNAEGNTEENKNEEAEADSGDDDDLSSIISGLTSLNSATTRQILLDCEQTVQTFLEDEGKAVQAILSVAGNSKSSARSGSDALGPLQSQAATEAENMVKQMQGILHEFEEKQKSLPADYHQGRPYYTSNPDEKWMIYYDETFQREYYHEVNTNRTQWHPPSQADVTDVTSLSTAEHSSSVLAHVDVMPEVQQGRSLIAAYRKKNRRRRKKRLALAAAATLSSVGAAYYVYETQPELVQSVREYMEPAQLALFEWFEEVRSSLVSVVEEVKQSSTPEPAVHQRVQLPPTLPFVDENKESQRSVEYDDEEEAMRRKLAEEAALKRAEEARRRRQAKALAEAAAEAARLEYLRRPAGCNIPLAYLAHSRCYRLASENPLYNTFDLVQSMMQ